MKTFQTLELAIQFYKLVEHIKITGNLRDQLLRASSSIALNLSEGNAKASVKEKKRYYQTAYASQKECQTILRLAQNQNQQIEKLADQLGAYLYKLLRSQITKLKSDY